MNIKKILLFSFVIMIIPFIVVTLFIRDDEITFNFNSNSVVRVYRKEKGVIQKVPIEQYVVGVVSGEIPINFEIEALKAQAVAARTYVMYQIQGSIKKDYDVVDTVDNQVYLSDQDLKEKWGNEYTQKINKVREAVLSTTGEYLTYNKKVIEAFFFSTSVGKTENSEDIFVEKLPYLRSVDSHWDSISPVFNDSVDFSKLEFFSNLELAYDNSIKIDILDTTNTGRIKKIKINDHIFTGKEVCSKLKLRSTYFKIIDNNDKVKIETKGFGHGVGMSQYGAQGMAQEGYSYEEILKHYYTNIEIDNYNE